MNQKGLTLVELITVIALVGILASVAVVKLGGLTTQARDRMIDVAYSIVRVALYQSVANTTKFPLPEDFKNIVINDIKLEKGITFRTDDPPTLTRWAFDIRVGESGVGRKATCTYIYTSETRADLSLGDKTDY